MSGSFKVGGSKLVWRIQIKFPNLIWKRNNKHIRYLIMFCMERNEIHLTLNMKTTTTTTKTEGYHNISWVLVKKYKFLGPLPDLPVFRGLRLKIFAFKKQPNDSDVYPA